MSEIVKSERVLLGPCVVSFPSVVRANDRGKYEVDIIYEKGSDVHKKLIELEKDAIKKQWAGKPPVGLIRLVKDGDGRISSRTGEVMDGYVGKLFSKAKSGRPPQVTDLGNNPIDDPMEIKGGDICVILAEVIPWPKKQPTHKDSILLGLLGIRKLRDGKRLGGSGSDVDAAYEMSNYQYDGEDECHF